jgi:hypothetical protein
MPIYHKCGQSVRDLANDVLCQFDTHRPLLDCKLSIDLVFAYAKADKDGVKQGPAITKNGVPALGVTRVVSLKDRALGRGDAEVCLDGDWWNTASEEQQKALLDHELHHISVKIDKRGLVRDDLGRPVLQMRKHDYEFGWFKVVAERQGAASVERRQAALMMDESGQAFWPSIAK